LDKDNLIDHPSNIANENNSNCNNDMSSVNDDDCHFLAGRSLLPPNTPKEGFSSPRKIYSDKGVVGEKIPNAIISCAQISERISAERISADERLIDIKSLHRNSFIHSGHSEDVEGNAVRFEGNACASLIVDGDCEGNINVSSTMVTADSAEKKVDDSAEKKPDDSAEKKPDDSAEKKVDDSLSGTADTDSFSSVTTTNAGSSSLSGNSLNGSNSLSGVANDASVLASALPMPSPTISRQSTTGSDLSCIVATDDHNYPGDTPGNHPIKTNCDDDAAHGESDQNLDLDSKHNHSSNRAVSVDDSVISRNSLSNSDGPKNTDSPKISKKPKDSSSSPKKVDPILTRKAGPGTIASLKRRYEKELLKQNLKTEELRHYQGRRPDKGGSHSMPASGRGRYATVNFFEQLTQDRQNKVVENKFVEIQKRGQSLRSKKILPFNNSDFVNDDSPRPTNSQSSPNSQTSRNGGPGPEHHEYGAERELNYDPKFESPKFEVEVKSGFQELELPIGLPTLMRSNSSYQGHLLGHGKLVTTRSSNLSRNNSREIRSTSREMIRNSSRSNSNSREMDFFEHQQTGSSRDSSPRLSGSQMDYSSRDSSPRQNGRSQTDLIPWRNTGSQIETASSSFTQRQTGNLQFASFSKVDKRPENIDARQLAQENEFRKLREKFWSLNKNASSSSLTKNASSSSLTQAEDSQTTESQTSTSQTAESESRSASQSQSRTRSRKGTSDIELDKGLSNLESSNARSPVGAVSLAPILLGTESQAQPLLDSARTTNVDDESKAEERLMKYSYARKENCAAEPGSSNKADSSDVNKWTNYATVSVGLASNAKEKRPVKNLKNKKSSYSSKWNQLDAAPWSRPPSGDILPVITP